MGHSSLHRALLCAALIVVWTATGNAQTAGSESRWRVFQRFQGSSGGAGQVLKLDTGAYYDLNQKASVGAGLPLYIVRDSTGADAYMKSGIGNAYVDLGFRLPVDPLYFYSSVQVSAPTGNRDEGFSTGRVTLVWNNGVSLPLGRMIPFANVGLANTVSDTAFFTRPFSSLGIVAHFEGGAIVEPAARLRLGASGYSIAPSGEQRVVSRIVRRTAPQMGPGRPDRVFETETEVVGDADLARDHGFSTWAGFYPGRAVSLSIGYSRSERYDLNSLFSVWAGVSAGSESSHRSQAEVLSRLYRFEE